MNKVIQCIESIRAKLDGFRRLSLKETPTRTIVIDPMLEALGWDVRDPNEVDLEYATVDGKSVDYALKINNKAVLLLEAKALDDPLNDVKAITQVVGYAANAGIVWCVLTNGVRWKVYRSVEKCAAPDKLMYEVSIDVRDSEGMSLEQLSQQLCRLSRDEMAKGTLDALGEQTFNDGKVRKALDIIMRDAPRAFLKLIRSTTRDEDLSPKKIGESLARIWRTTGSVSGTEAPEGVPESPPAISAPEVRRQGALKAAQTRREKGAVDYDENHHTADKPQEVIELYRALNSLCLSMQPEAIEKKFNAKTIGYFLGPRAGFCSLHLDKKKLRVWLRLDYAGIDNPPSFARDVSHVGHWGAGDLELAIGSAMQLEQAVPLIRKSFEAVAQGIDIDDIPM
jgi:predicted type IV restriction endonuclease/predicted transport protein